MNRLITILALTAAVLLTDVHWGVMQSITWAKMVAVQSSDESLSSRIAQAISGEAPCDHCLALESERTSEQEEILDLLAKSQVLGPINAGSVKFSHPGFALFNLDAPQFVAPGIAPPGIDRPPRA